MASKDLRRANSTIHDMELDVLKENLRNKHKQISQEVDEKIDRIFDEFFIEVNKLSLNRFEVEKLFNDGKNGKNSKTKNDKQKKVYKKHEQKMPERLPEKHFQPRTSMLTELFEIKHVSTIYHIFIVIFNLLLLNTFVTDFVHTGKINIGLDPIITGFRGFHYALFIWSMMQLTIFAIFPVFSVWASLTKKYFSKSGFMTSSWHFFGVLSIIAYEIGFIFVFTKAVVHFNLGQASSVAALMEIVRFIMKSYAFIRTNVPRALNQGRRKLKSSSESELSDDVRHDPALPASGSPKVNDKRPLPTFGQFTFFLFAPTLIYRDEYPRSKHVRWNFIFKCCVEILSIIFILSFISERMFYPLYKTFGSEFYGVDVKELVGQVFNSMLPGLLCFLCGFYCVSLFNLI